MIEVIDKLIHKIDLREGWFGNERDLAKLDAESLLDELDGLEERVEELEWDTDDYYTIDKDKFETKMNATLVNHFFNKEGGLQVPYEHIEHDVIHDMIEEIVDDSIKIIEKESEKN